MQIAERGIPQEQYSRRVFLDRSIRTGVALTAAPVAIAILEGCGPTATPTPEIYRGNIKNIEGRPFISKERMETLSRLLSESGEPLLEKVARDVTTLRTSETNPSDLPPIIAEDATPLVITRDYDVSSLALHSADLDKDKPGFIFDKDSGRQEWPFAKPVSIAIHIGANPKLEDKDPMQEAILLAKEEINLMTGLHIMETYQVVNPEGVVRNPDGTEMTDPALLERANYTIGLTKYSRDKGSLWALNDIVPMMLLAPTIFDLITAGKLPQSSGQLSALYIAANHVFSDQTLLNKVVELQKSWAQSKSIYGPEGFGVELYDPKIIEAVNTLFPQIYPEGI